ncbi:MAG: YggT family protein [Gemmatimonadaceae bacterium]
MNVVYGALATIAAGMRTVLLAGGVALATVAAADWAVRTRRINPFGGVARFLRNTVDPRLAGVEKQVVRAGGHPSQTPLWALVGYVVIAALILAAFDLLVGVVAQAIAASSLGGYGIVVLLLHWTFSFLRLAVMIRVISSWFPRLAYSVWARWTIPATEWMLRPLRRVIPTIGMIDITPIVAYFGLQLVESLILPALLPGF